MEVADVLERGKLIDGRYRIERVAGQGAFGVVYEAHHISLDTRVAIKVLRTEAAGPAAVGQFLSEARMLVALRHPAVVRVLDAGVIDGKPYFAMEWCDGPTLAKFMEEKGPLGVSEAWKLLEPVFEAIAHSHEKGVVHRDIKPSNVVLFEGSARVIDFGIAKVVAPDDAPGGGDTTTVGRSAFTPKYASPEQLAGSRTGPWTDVYALALLFTELVGGSVSDPLAPVFARAMARRPADRYADAGALMAAVRVALTPRRPRWWLVALPLAVLAAGAFVVHALGTRSHAEDDRSHTVASSAESVSGDASAASASAAAPASASAPIALALAPSTSSSVVSPSPGGSAHPALPITTRVGAAHSNGPTAPSGPGWAFSVNGYQNGGFAESDSVQDVTRVAGETRPCFPDPKPDELWNAYLVVQWPKGRPRELQIEVKKGRETILNDLGGGQRTGAHDAVAEGIARCVRAKFDAANISEADGQDSMANKTAYDKLDVGWFPR